MTEPDSLPEAAATRELLRRAPLFRHLDDAELTQLELALEWFALPGGATLFDAGEPPDALYVLRSGSLGAFRVPAEGGDAKLIGVVAAGETVGELGLIVDQPRSATVRALRDSELMRLSRASFEALVQRQPKAMLEAARIAVDRLLSRTGGDPLSEPRTMAILPHDAGVDAIGFTTALRQVLSDYGSCLVLDAATGAGRTSGWFSEREATVRYVLYLADSAHSEWRELCVRQADTLVLLADVETPDSPWPELVCASATAALHRPRHLVLLHPRGEIRLGAARRWLAHAPGARLHHVRRALDIDRVGRLIIGRSLGLVLSGGGARGFAHIGVIKALREAGMRIDSVGGTSIGAIIGAGVAADWSDEEMFERYRRAFVVGRPLGDYTLPFVAMTSGRRVTALLREAFGERDIEDLALPFFAVSANLTKGCAAVHREGRLWYWLRASSAIPGVLPPLLDAGQVHVDGGVINNLPADVMRAQSVGDVIAIDIGADDVLRAQNDEVSTPPWWRMVLERFGPPRRPGLANILLRAGMVNAEAASAERRKLVSLLLKPPLRGIGLLDWQDYELAIEKGYQYALREIGGQKDALTEDTPLFVSG